MPVHDWTKVTAGNVHDFLLSWTAAISQLLNEGLLPESFYSMVQPRNERLLAQELDVLNGTFSDTLVNGVVRTLQTVETRPPKVTYSEELERDIYAERADHIAVYHANGDRVVAYIEIVSPGNKQREGALENFLKKLNEAYDNGIHLLVIDLHPPGPCDPQGLHAAFWKQRGGTAHPVTPEKPLGLAAYRVGEVENIVLPVAYFEPVAIGQALPDMPLFLTPHHYIDVPLEETYMRAWKGVPDRWKRVIEGQAGQRNEPA